MKRARAPGDADPSLVLTGLEPDDTLEIVRLETEGPTHEDLMKGTKSILSDMNFNGAWEELIARLKQAYPQLIDEDLSLTEGGETEWLIRLGGKLGESEEQIRSIIAKL